MTTTTADPMPKVAAISLPSASLLLTCGESSSITSPAAVAWGMVDAADGVQCYVAPRRRSGESLVPAQPFA